MGQDVEKPLWLKLVGCGFAAVMAASLAIGGHGLFREYALGDAALADQSKRNIEDVFDDMDAQRRTAAAMALVLAGEQGVGDLIIGKKREELLAPTHLACRPSRPPRTFSG